jgi:hypothetical protein
MFSRKHYNAIAKALKESKLKDKKEDLEIDNYVPFTIEEQWTKVRDTMIRIFERDNPLFVRRKFIYLCE